MFLKAGMDKYDGGGGSNTVNRPWCLSAQDDFGNNNVNIINSEIITLSSTIYNNYNNTLATQYSIFNTLINNENTIYSYGYSISGNLKSANCLSHFIITYISYSFSVAQPTLNIFPLISILFAKYQKVHS